LNVDFGCRPSEVFEEETGDFLDFLSRDLKVSVGGHFEVKVGVGLSSLVIILDAEALVFYLEYSVQVPLSRLIVKGLFNRGTVLGLKAVEDEKVLDVLEDKVVE
jgi:hypothetical protein